MHKYPYEVCYPGVAASALVMDGGVYLQAAWEARAAARRRLAHPKVLTESSLIITTTCPRIQNSPAAVLPAGAVLSLPGMEMVHLRILSREP